MNKLDPSSNPSDEGNKPDPDIAPRNPTEGEGTAHKQTRTRAPQFGSDRRGPHSENRHPKSTHQYAQNPADPDGPPQNSESAMREPERRIARKDRRRSVSQRS